MIISKTSFLNTLAKASCSFKMKMLEKYSSKSMSHTALALSPDGICLSDLMSDMMRGGAFYQKKAETYHICIIYLVKVPALAETKSVTTASISPRATQRRVKTPRYFDFSIKSLWQFA
jgi:hypothetical protein